MEKKESRRKDMKKSKKKLTSFLYSENFFNDIGEERISVELNGNGLSLHSKKETKVVTGENAGKTIRENNSDRKCICSQSYFSFRIKWKYGI